MQKNSIPQESLEFTIPIADIVPNMIVTKEILNNQDNILIPQNYKIKNDVGVDRVQRLLQQNNIECIHVKLEKELPDSQLEDFIHSQTAPLEKEVAIQEKEHLVKILESLAISDKSFLMDALPECKEKFDETFAAIAEGNLQEVDTLETQIIESMEMLKKSVSIFQIMDKLKKLEASFYVHCYNIGITSYMIGKWLELEEEETQELFACGMVSDIGLLKVPPTIRYKLLDLSKEEKTEYDKHAEHSYSLLKDSTFINQDSKYAILYHHATVDRKGYPFGYDGKKVPLFSKILYIAQLYCYYTQTKQENPLKAIHLMRTYHLEEVDLDTFYVFEKRICNYFIGQKVKVHTEESAVGDVVMINYSNASILIKKEDDSFVAIPLNTFYNNLAEFV